MRSATERKSILVIDDFKMIRSSLRQALEASGYSVCEAQEGEEGLEILDKAPADLVITDIIMPGMEGIETIMMIRKRHPDVKVLAISGGGGTRKGDLLDMAQRLGAHRTLAKPFTSEALVACVRQILAD